VVGFDDIQFAVHNNPSLTTVRQPLQKMGEIAARTLLDRIEERGNYVSAIAIEPEFVVRGSTAQAPVKRSEFTFCSAPRRPGSAPRRLKA